MKKMRIIKQLPKFGDQKVIKKFLWWPKTIGNETRWLEKSDILYEYTRYGTMESGIILPCVMWVPIKFITK